MAHLQLTMQAGSRIPREEEGNVLKGKILDIPIPDGTSEIILTEKLTGGHVKILKILVSTQKATE